MRTHKYLHFRIQPISSTDYILLTNYDCASHLGLTKLGFNQSKFETH